MDMLSIAVMAIAYTLSPGPVNIATIGYGIKGEIKAAFMLKVAALLGSAVYAFFALSGMSAFLNNGPVQVGLALVGMGLLVYLGVASFKPQKQLATLADPLTLTEQWSAISGSLSNWQTFRNGVLLAMTNPLALVFWPTLASLTTRGSYVGLIEFIVTFFIVAILCSGFFALSICWFRILLTPRGFLGLSRLCGIVLIGFGLKLGFTIVGLL